MQQAESGRFPSGPSDEALLAAVARGDEEALAALYDRHSSVLYSFALRITNDPQSAEEAVQNTFVSVWRSASTFDSLRSSALTWLVTIVKNRARDLVRTSLRRPKVASLDWDVVDAQAPDPVSSADDRLQAELVRTALSALPREQRDVLRLTYYFGLSHREAAEHLGIPLGTVKSRIRLALDRLSVFLANQRFPT